MPKLNGIEIPQNLWDSLGPDTQKRFTGNPEYSVPYFNEDGQLIGIGSQKGIHWGWGTVRSNKNVVSNTGHKPYANIPDTPPPSTTSTTSSTSKGSSSVSPQSEPVTPVPLTPSLMSNTSVSPISTVSNPEPVRTAPIDTILINENNIPIDIMTDLIFQNIGGQELINISRNDIVNGQKIIYQPIKNLYRVQQEFNPNNIISLQSTSDKYFENFAIKLNNKVPNVGSGPGGAYIYIDTSNGDLVIESVNLNEDEQVELEIVTSGTIYEADL
jgi:hypothetical protein